MAGSNDFTGQNIQDTYQRVLQLSSSGQVADGTGSLVSLLETTSSFATNAITASHALFAVSASHEITFELSSSHAQTADTASFINSTTLDTFKTTGTRLGDGFIDGNITSSGNISASGNVDAFLGRFSQILIDGESALNTGDNATRGSLFPDGQITTIQIGKPDSLTSTIIVSNVTASGNISASGTIVGSNLSGTNTGDQDLSNLVTNDQTASFAVTGSDVIFGNITASGNISASGDVYATDLYIGGQQFVDVTVNENIFGIGTLGQGSLQLTNITASGNISASGDNHAFGGKTFIGDTTNEAGAQSMLTVGGAAGTNVKIYSTNIATNRNVGLHLSASANGQQYSIGLNRPNNTLFISPARVGDGPSEAVFEIDASGNITASGNISSSGTIIGNALTLSGLSNQGSEATAVVIDGSDIVGTRELGSNAFTSTTIGTMTNALTVDNATLELDSGTTFDGSAAKTISVKDGGIDSDALAANIAVTQLTASIVSASELIIRGAKGHITASGNISASGNILGDVFISNGISVLNNPGGATTNTTLNSVNRGLLVQGTNIQLNAKVTASQGLGVIGNVSASGDLIGGGLNINGTTTFNDGNITNVGQIDLDGIRADAATNVQISLGTSGVDVVMETGDAFTINSGEIDADFTYFDSSENSLIHGDAGLSRVGINDTSPSSKLDIGGDLNVQSHITASGNISSSLISKIQAGSGSFHILQGDTTQDAALDVEGSITASVGIKTANLVLTNLSNQGSEATAVVIDGSNIVGTRELGSNAFTSTTVGTTTNALTVDNATLQLNSGTTFDGSAARTISIKDGGVDSDALAADIAVTTLVATSITASGDISASGNFVGSRQFDLPEITGTTQGDIVYFGSPAPDFAQGRLHYLASNGTWALADKDSDTTAGQCLLAFALGAAPSNGMLLRGMFRYGSDLGTVGDVLYVGDSGVPTNDVSGFSNPDIIRIIGYLLESTNGTIWFNPDNTFIKKA